MRRLLVVLSAFLAGCTLPAPAPGEPDALVAAEAFDRVESPWVAEVTGGCGMCMARGDFGPYASHHALFAFADGRVALLEWNAVPGAPNATRLHENVTFDAALAEALLRTSPRGEGKVWLVRVYTARAASADLPDGLAASWGRGSRDVQCTDDGVSYLLRRANGTVEREDFSCGPAAGEPLDGFARVMGRLVDETRARGVLQGAGP